MAYTHPQEGSPPVEVQMMMRHADLYDQSKWPDGKVKDGPLSFSDLRGTHDATNYYQNIDDNYHQGHGGDPVVYCRGTVASGHAFLQYYHFETSSCWPESSTPYHEGDWEMFQIAVKLDTGEEQMTPIAVTGAQHYYGQTIRWAAIGNGPASQDQDYVGKSDHRPKVYVALNAHATYFRDGDFKTRTGSDNHGDQYDSAPNDWPTYDDETGASTCTYELRTFHDSMISDWKGKWGRDRFLPKADGPYGPKYKETAEMVWDDPKGFHNYYLKLQSYPHGAVKHTEIEID